MSRHIWLLIGVACGLAGCVMVKPVQLPDGRAGHSLSGCGDLAKCMNKAAEICSGPYQVIGSQDHNVVVNGYGGSSVEIVIACGEAAPAADPKP